MMNEIKIHDIKDLTQIPDISFYLFILIIILGTLIAIIFIFILFKFFNNRKKNKRKEYYKILKDLDLKNSKKSAYIISKNIRLLAQNDREKRLAKELIEELEKYKYRKEVNELDDNVKIIFARFMDNIDV